jgi:hypothetical protein
MQVIVVIGRTEAGATQTILPEQLEDEIAYVRKRYGAETIRQIWSRVGVGGAVMLLEVPKVEDGSDLVAKLPLSLAGILRLEGIFPLIPFKGFAGS